MRNRGFKVMLLSFLFIIPLMLVTIKPVYAGPNPPPVEGHWMGPAVIADLTFRPATSEEIVEHGCTYGDLVLSGEARCYGNLVPIPENFGLCIDFNFDEVAADTIPDWLWDPVDFFPPDSGCVPDIEDLKGIAIQTVISYEEYTDPALKKAKVIMLFIVPKGN